MLATANEFGSLKKNGVVSEEKSAIFRADYYFFLSLGTNRVVLNYWMPFKVFAVLLLENYGIHVFKR